MDLLESTNELLRMLERIGESQRETQAWFRRFHAADGTEPNQEAA